MNAHSDPPASFPIQTFEQFQAETRRLLAPPREARLGRISIGDLSKRKIVPPNFVVDQWMIASETSFLAGESQSGKSFLALHAGMCIATGRDVLGRRTKPGLVIYLAAESGFGVTGLRIPAWIQHFGEGADFSEIPFEIIPARVNLFRPDGNAEEFHQVVKAIQKEWEGRAELRLIVIDTMSKVMSGANENDGRDVGKVLEHADRLCRETGAHVCFVHHLPKNGTGMRGHGSLKGDTDSVVMVNSGPNGVRTITFDKVKDGEAGGKLAFELMQVRLGDRDDGKPVTSCVVLQVGEKEVARKAHQSEGFALFGDDLNAAFRAFLDAKVKTGKFADEDMEAEGVSPGAVAVHYRDWKAAYLSHGPCGSDGSPLSDDAVTKRLQRLKNKLVDLKVCSWARPWIWHNGGAIKGFPETRSIESYARNDRSDQSGQSADNIWTNSF